MRRVRYSVAMSVDGYIAGPNGEIDWILMDPEIDFAAMFGRYDTVLLGRRTYELTLTQGGEGGMQGMKAVVFSRTLRAADHPDVTLVAEDAGGAVAELRAREGRDIWLMGGGVLFRSLLDARQVDEVEIAVIPVLLGAGIPMLSPPARQARLRLTASRTLKTTGIILLDYAVEYGTA